MKIVVVGATGNVGTSLLRALESEAQVDELVGIARRLPERPVGAARMVAADITVDELEPLLAGADAVIHLAWLIQPGRDESITARVNLEGSRRVFRATVSAGVPALVYASSVGAYSPGPKDQAVDESWPTNGISTSFYSRHKVATERELDRLQAERPQLRVVRLRPALIFQRSAASEIRRLFAGPLLPGWLLRSELAPVAPDVPRLRFQAVHADDVADAYRRATLSDARGAFNVAAEPAIGVAELAEMMHARPVRVPARLLRGAAAASYALHLQPAEPGWVDMALGVPLMSTERARRELGWEARHSATDALAELIAGLREGAGADTPPLHPSTGGPARLREFLTGVGRRP